MISPRVACFLWLLGATAMGADASSWMLVQKHADFAPRDSCGEVAFGGRMWIMGGWMGSFEDPPRDVWSSKDGIAWTKASDQAPWKHSDFAMTAVFQGKMWVMGGWHGGRLPHASASNSVWSSSDGADWKLEIESAGWSPRMCGGLVVHDDMLFLMGGTQQYYFGDDEDLKNDVWCSRDGKHWERLTDHAPWSPRAYLAPVSLNGRIYVFGGGNYLPNEAFHHDVWSSSDGKEWTLETEAAAWAPRIWFTSAVYRGHLWILGGWSSQQTTPARPGGNFADIWYSRDGETWHEYNAPVSWAQRHEHSTYVFQDKLWVVAGMKPPLNNEVWSLTLPQDWNGKTFP
jgi:hypothetical protein